MKKNNHILGFTILLLTSVITTESQATIFKCVNAQGETVYHDKPCAASEKATTLNSVKDPENGYIPPAYVEDAVVKTNKEFVVIGDTEVEPNSEEKVSKSDDTNSLNNKGEGAEPAENSEEAIVMKLANLPENKIVVPATSGPTSDPTAVPGWVPVSAH